MSNNTQTSTGRTVAIVVGTIMLLGLSTCATCAVCMGGAATQVAKQEQEKTKQLELTLKQCGDVEAIPWANIAAALKDNEAKVAAAWKGRCVKISGIVDAIDSDLNDQPVVRLGSGERFGFKHCNCRPADPQQALNLSKGEKLTVWGVGGNEIIGSLELEHCRW